MSVIDQIGDGGVGVGDCWVWQLKKALVADSNFFAVDGLISADPDNTLNIVWTSGGRTSVGDSLSEFVKSTLGLTDTEVQLLYEAAIAQTF